MSFTSHRMQRESILHPEPPRLGEDRRQPSDSTLNSYSSSGRSRHPDSRPSSSRGDESRPATGSQIGSAAASPAINSSNIQPTPRLPPVATLSSSLHFNYDGTTTQSPLSKSPKATSILPGASALRPVPVLPAIQTQLTHRRSSAPSASAFPQPSSAHPQSLRSVAPTSQRSQRVVTDAFLRDRCNNLTSQFGGLVEIFNDNIIHEVNFIRNAYESMISERDGTITRLRAERNAAKNENAQLKSMLAASSEREKSYQQADSDGRASEATEVRLRRDLGDMMKLYGQYSSEVEKLTKENSYLMETKRERQRAYENEIARLKKEADEHRMARSMLQQQLVAEQTRGKRLQGIVGQFSESDRVKRASVQTAPDDDWDTPMVLIDELKDSPEPLPPVGASSTLPSPPESREGLPSFAATRPLSVAPHRPDHHVQRSGMSRGWSTPEGGTPKLVHAPIRRGESNPDTIHRQPPMLKRNRASYEHDLPPDSPQFKRRRASEASEGVDTEDGENTEYSQADARADHHPQDRFGSDRRMSMDSVGDPRESSVGSPVFELPPPPMLRQSQPRQNDAREHMKSMPSLPPLRAETSSPHRYEEPTKDTHDHSFSSRPPDSSGSTASDHSRPPPPPPPPPTLSIKHYRLLYQDQPSGIKCIHCKTQLKMFPANTSWNELVGHSKEAHEAICEGILSKPAYQTWMDGEKPMNRVSTADKARGDKRKKK